MSASRRVYVIGGQSGPQKIGISTDPAQRLQAVQSHSPDVVLLHHQVLPDDDARLVERVAHHLLRAKRMRGEWFDVEIAEAVAAIGQAIDLVEAGDLSILGSTDRRINTTLRLEPEKLERLKIIAARKRIRVNDLLLEGVDHVLALYSLGTAA